MHLRRKILTIICLITIGFSLFLVIKKESEPRDGYLVLRSAEVAFKLKHYQQSLNYLDIAKKSDFGFCLNAHIDAHKYIDSLYAQICSKLSE